MSFLCVILLFLLLVNGKYTQHEAQTCLLKQFDTDGNGGVSREELEHNIRESPIRALYMHMFGPMIFKECDADHNGQITAHDMFLANTTCCVSWRTLWFMEKLCNNK